jgi:hypothetical protein
VSDRTLRVIINEFRRFAEQRQWQIVIPMLCQPVRDWFTRPRCSPARSSRRRTRCREARRVGAARLGLHPSGAGPAGQENRGRRGLPQRSSVVGERGDDPEVVDAERAQDGIDNNEYPAPSPTVKK